MKLLSMAIPQICSRMDNCEYHYLNDTTNLLLPSFKFRSSRPEVFLRKSALKICSKFTGEHPCRSAVSIKLLCNFIKIVLRHGCSLVNLQHIIEIPFLKNTSGGLLLSVASSDNLPFILDLNLFEKKLCLYFNIHINLCVKSPSDTL